MSIRCSRRSISSTSGDISISGSVVLGILLPLPKYVVFISPLTCRWSRLVIIPRSLDLSTSGLVATN